MEEETYKERKTHREGTNYREGTYYHGRESYRDYREGKHYRREKGGEHTWSGDLEVDMEKANLKKRKDARMQRINKHTTAIPIAYTQLGRPLFVTWGGGLQAKRNT